MHVHLLGTQHLAALRAHHDGIEQLAASLVLVQQRAAALVAHMAVAPMHHRHDDRIEVEPLLGEDVFVALWCLGIGDAAQDAEPDQLLQPLREQITERVFRKVWEMACYSGFLAGREAARLMLPRGGGNIFFTGATASLRGGSGFAAFASAKFGLRAIAQAMARELGPKNIHVAHLIIDSGVDTEWVRQRRLEALGPNALDNPDLLMPPSSVADAYWQLYQQPKSAWTFEMEIRPFGEKW